MSKNHFTLKQLLAYLFLAVLLCGCGQTAKQKAEKPKSGEKSVPDTGQQTTDNNSYAGFLSSIVKIQTFDKGRVLETGQGFFVDDDLIVTRFTLMNGANQATFTTLNDDTKHNIAGFMAIDRINDLVLLKTDGTKGTPIQLYSGIAPKGSKTIYLTRPTGKTIPLHKGKILDYSKVNGKMAYTVTNQFLPASYGMPLFLSDKQTIGLAFSEIVDYALCYFVTPSTLISELIKKKNQPAALANINQADKAVSETNSKLRGLIIETDMGDIKIRLFNETPAYRDNFIKLTREHYFDSLLIHRVIKGFCIQSGAADTRYAGKDDVVGWKGPGYTLPAHIVPGLFHKRGMIGSPRKPDTKNSKFRSDGSQFYIVTGRTYTDAELNEIEQQDHIRFTAEQRKVYKTIGGAPHIDGTYTIFGEVTAGMDVADRISQVETGKDFRPLNDIRIKRIRIIE